MEQVLVMWKHSSGLNLTSKTKEKKKKGYPNLIDYNAILRTKSFKGVRYVRTRNFV